MQKIDRIMSQEEYEELTLELFTLETEEQLDAKDHGIRIREIKKLIEINNEEE